jgi:heptosyltransferase II
MTKTLIIKTGASGDVIRTTVLLHIIQGEVYWLTTPYNTVLLPAWVKTIPFSGVENTLSQHLHSIEFDLVINLEEDVETARLVSALKKNKVIGVYWEDDQINYTSESAPWFDMSLVSVYGKKNADELKIRNQFSLQEILYSMFSKSFSGEKYLLREFPVATKNHFIVGLEKNAGSRWPNKSWFGYEEMNEMLIQEGYKTVIFQQRNTLTEYITDIARCGFIITGDTLAMHVSLAFEIPCLAIFTCTSPAEIYDYGILTKIVSPRLDEFFYKSGWDPASSTAIPVTEVLEQFKMAAKS